MNYLQLFLSNYKTFILNGHEPTLLHSRTERITKPTHYEQKCVHAILILVASTSSYDMSMCARNITFSVYEFSCHLGEPRVIGHHLDFVFLILHRRKPQRHGCANF
jgi:hypothetical protein